MAFLDWIGSAVETVGTFMADTFGGGSANSKLSAQNAQLSASIEQQKALLASYQGTLQQLTSQMSQKNMIPLVIAGVGVLGAVLLLTRGRGRI